MSTKSHYQILEVPRDTAERELKRAYHKLAKRYHPDKATSGNEAKEFEHQMALVSQAYNILKDPKRREEYDSQLKKEKTNTAQLGAVAAGDKSEAFQRRATIAAKALAKGVQLMKGGESKRAIEFLEAAVENNPEEPLAHAKLAEALIDSKKSFTRATEHAEKAIELDPWNSRLRLILGRIYEEAGRTTL
jgi:DnaJ-class molecular chaperone